MPNWMGKDKKSTGDNQKGHWCPLCKMFSEKDSVKVCQWCDALFKVGPVDKGGRDRRLELIGRIKKGK